MPNYMFGSCRQVKAFKSVYPLTLPSGAQVFSEFATVDAYMENARKEQASKLAGRKEKVYTSFSLKVRAELDKLDVRKQPIYRRT